MTGESIGYQTKMGRVGHRSRPALNGDVDNLFVDSTYPPLAYGVPVKNISGKMGRLVTNDAANSVIGIITMPTVDDQPSVGNEAMGTTTPNPARMHGLVRNDYIFVTCLGSTAPAAEGQAYARVRDNGSTLRAIGTIEAAAGQLAVTAAAAAGNTGNGVLTLASPAYVTGCQAGIYRAVFIEPATDLGNFVVFDPLGVEVAKGTVGSAYSNQIAFTIADGATDFVAGDAFAITVVADCEPIPGVKFTSSRDSDNTVEVRVKL